MKVIAGVVGFFGILTVIVAIGVRFDIGSPPQPRQLSAEEQRLGETPDQWTVREHIRQRAHDPRSIRIESFRDPVPATIESGEAWFTVIRYSGTNAFGARVTHTAHAWIRHGRIVEWQDIN